MKLCNGNAAQLHIIYVEQRMSVAMAVSIASSAGNRSNFSKFIIGQASDSIIDSE